MEEEAFEAKMKFRRTRRVEVLRRLLEAALLLSVGVVVLYQDGARSLAWTWRKGTRKRYDDIEREMLIDLQRLLPMVLW
jgi:hypothetical protein